MQQVTQNNYFSGTESQIPKNLTVNLDIYLRKFINLHYIGTLEAPFSPRFPKFSLTGSSWVFMTIQDGPLSLDKVPQ